MPPKKRSKIAKSGKSKGASPVAVAGSEGDSDDHGNNTEESQGSQQEVPNLQRHPQGGDNDGELTETQRPSNIKRKKDFGQILVPCWSYHSHPWEEYRQCKYANTQTIHATFRYCVNPYMGIVVVSK